MAIAVTPAQAVVLKAGKTAATVRRAVPAVVRAEAVAFQKVVQATARLEVDVQAPTARTKDGPVPVVVSTATRLEWLGRPTFVTTPVQVQKPRLVAVPSIPFIVAADAALASDALAGPSRQGGLTMVRLVVAPEVVDVHAEVPVGQVPEVEVILVPLPVVITVPSGSPIDVAKTTPGLTA